jgi:metal-responsive CopG/Arc/MetJ family transcriptional regulator
MSKMIAVRLKEDLLERVDQECKRARLSRAAAINEALDLWVDKRRYEEAVRSDHEGYARHPVAGDEFEAVLGAQSWPK